MIMKVMNHGLLDQDPNSGVSGVSVWEVYEVLAAEFMIRGGVERIGKKGGLGRGGVD